MNKLLASNIIIFVHITVLVLAMPTPKSVGNCECKHNDNLDLNELICKEQTDILTNLVDFDCDFDKLVITSSDIKVIYNDSFSTASDLTIVHMYSNSIDTVDEAAFRDLTNLNEVDLSDNDLINFDPWLFSENQHLETVVLSSNYLVDIDETSPILSSKSLTTLLLDDCNLSTVTKEMLSELPNLEKLDISSNNIQTLSLSVFDKVPNLNRLEIHNNRWSCDCELKYLITFANKIRTDKSVPLQPIKCVTPERDMVVWTDEISDKYCISFNLIDVGIFEELEHDLEAIDELTTESSEETILLAEDSITASFTGYLNSIYCFLILLFLFIFTLCLTAFLVRRIRQVRRSRSPPLPTNKASNKDNKFYMLNVQSRASAFTSTDQLLPNEAPRDVIYPMYSDQLPIAFQHPARSNIHIYESVQTENK